jgi:hypothetical protein
VTNNKVTLIVKVSINRGLPSQAAQVLSQFSSYRIYDGENSTGMGFLLVLAFLLSVLSASAAFHQCCIVSILTALLNNQLNTQEAFEEL